MTLQQFAPRARRVAAVVVLGSTLVGALICSEIVRAFTRPKAPKGTPPTTLMVPVTLDGKALHEALQRHRRQNGD